MIKVIKSYYEKSVLLFLSKKYSDKRGYFSETFNKKDLSNIGIKEDFVQDNLSFSKNKNVIRGLHLQKTPMQQSKIIRVLNGSILDVVLDLRKNSSTYGKSLQFYLSKENFNQLYISENFAHGFCTLTNNTEVLYKTSNYYSKKDEVTILWNDPDLNIDWQIDNRAAIVSKKDSKGLRFKDYTSNFID